MTIMLIVLTSIYLIVASWQDLKERKIYSFPCNILSALWIIKIAMEMRMPSYLYLIYLSASLALYFVFTNKKIWGAGDSDLFFLFSVVYLSCVRGFLSIQFLLIEILLFIGVLVSALFYGWLEARVKKIKIDKKSSIAVAPGFAVVIIAMMWIGVIGC